jgi:transcriptional regulator with XRE-family HTH domain
MGKVRMLFEKSGKTLDQLGREMGYPHATARKSVWQFMKTSDPRISTLRRFAAAMGVSLQTLLADQARDKAQKPQG